MGYTHHYTVQAGTRDLMVDEIGDDILALIANTDVPIVNGWGTPGTAPEITSSGIALNGAEPDGYETFSYPGRSFCKTEHRPYDIVVAAAHLVIKYHLGDQVEISSDGSAGDQEWVDARGLFESTFPGRNASGLMPRR